MDGYKHPLEDKRVSDIEADEDQDKDKNDNDDNEGGYCDQPQKPLRWLSYSGTPGKDISSIRGLYIDAHPVRLADISLFDEETDKPDIATAVATIFWNWHPNTLRALLDRDRFC